MGYYTNDLKYSSPQSKPRRSGNNTVQNVTQPQGYYLGSATNITRLFIFVIFLFTIIISCISFYYGKELGRLEQKIDSSRIIPCVSGGSYERVSKRT